MKLLRYLSGHLYELSKAATFGAALLFILWVFPREGRFKYDYRQGKPWMHEDLIAPYDFPILKPKEELEKQKARLLATRPLFFRIDPSVYPARREIIAQSLLDFMGLQAVDTLRNNQPVVSLIREALIIADTLFSRGIIQVVPEISDLPPEATIHLVINNKSRTVPLHRFYTILSADEYIIRKLKSFPRELRPQLKLALEMGLTHNIFFDRQLTEKTTEELLATLPDYQGMVQQGEKVISQGEVVTAERFQVLESLKAEAEARAQNPKARLAIFVGQFILISLALLVLALFLYIFRPAVFADNRKVAFIILIIVLMTALTSLVVTHRPWALYAIPLCLVPIIIRMFFDTRLALYVHIITMILTGFLVPNSFEFVFLQLIAGLIAIFSVANLQRRQQFISTAFYVFLAYSVVYTGLYLIQEGRFTGLRFFNFALFAGASGLLLLAYPAITVLEKIFGFVTDITLLELSDTNHPVLREISSKAPGTFHHSLQVANLAEEVIRRIGGNPLLVRAGAMYHDIGKIDNPMYFIENQYTGYNPHEELTPEESAEIILSHVSKGIEKARKLRLPSQIIDFIRTHHGTNRVEYFYRKHVQTSNGGEINEAQFRYRGPVPFSRETAVLMMADSVEAATRSLSKPDEASINTMVDRIVDSLMHTHQLDNAPLSLKDITEARKVLKLRLLHVYHIRIPYPSS
ncbi:MAG: HD family phosphohydrolase [Bacteroidales bacterium]